MRILYLNQYFRFPDQQGSTRAYDLASSFVKKNMDVVMIGATSEEKFKNSKRWNVIRRDGLEVHYIYLPYDNRLSYWQRSVVFFKFVWFSSFHLLKLKGDLVLASSTPLTIGVPALVKKWFGRTPYIFEVRDVWPEAVIAIGAVRNKFLQRVLYKLEKQIYKNAAAIIPLSSDMKASIERRYPKYKAKTGPVVENIAEIRRFQEQNRDRDIIKNTIGWEPRFTVLYAGTFGRVNGIHNVVDLAEQTMKFDRQLVFVLFGTGAEKENVIARAQKKGILNKNIFILEPVSKQELPDWYAAADMGSSFVIDIPELWANSANKFFDTLAAGRPVLINHEGWQAETIRNYKVGYVLPQVISPAAAKDFVSYSMDDTLHAGQRVNALRLAKEKYSLEKATEKYMEVFRKVS